jgi:hypothetical protein
MTLTQESLPSAVSWQPSELPAERGAQPGWLVWDPLALASSLGQHPAELVWALPAALLVLLMRRMTGQKELQAEVRPEKGAMPPCLLHRLHSKCRMMLLGQALPHGM